MKSISPNLFLNCQSDDEMIQKAVFEANKNHTFVYISKLNQRTNSNVWIISKAIILPSNTKIVLDGAHLVMADNTFDNMFRNENYGLEKRDNNISIIGKNGALLDGGKYNGLSEINALKNGLPSIHANHIILFKNAENLSFKNIKIFRQRHWAFCFYYCSSCKLDHIDFDTEGNVPNQDGIDLRIGCHDFTISNISGCCGDDVIALTALKEEKAFRKDEMDHDIHDVVIKNVKAYGVCGNAMIRLLNHDGRKIYNINIKNINEVSPYSINDYPVAINPDTPENINESGMFEVKNPIKKGEHGYRLSACIRIGENFWYKDQKGQVGEIYNIKVSNVKTHSRYAIALNNNIINSSFTDFKLFGNGFMGVYFGSGEYHNLRFDNFRYDKNIIKMNDDQKIDVEWNNTHSKGYYAFYQFDAKLVNVKIPKVKVPSFFDGETNF